MMVWFNVLIMVVVTQGCTCDKIACSYTHTYMNACITGAYIHALM